ncbi:MAG: response regulator transcription factor [Bacteroidota bacterium]
MNKITILLIEDNRLLQEAIVAMLHSHSNFEVIARSEDGDALHQFKLLDTLPRIVLLDMGLERINSLELMELIREEAPSVKIIAMDIIPDDVDIVEFVKAGGDGFILKNAPVNDWINTISAVARGEKVLPPMLTRTLFMQIVDNVINSNEAYPISSIQLTAREQEVVDLISEGLSNKEIAERLHIATYTVKSHVHNVLEKLDLSTRLQVAAYFRNPHPD